MKNKDINTTMIMGAPSAIFLKEYLTENIPEFKTDESQQNDSDSNSESN